ncbi:LPS assembly protein LptD [Marinicella sp. S1101]|uniref:LPS-assembly protein LptD n=1 Tax=Marinicella marina TaxID=2996016 RepID=UPI002260DAF2|nr:LPS assembly protein LptD [Marinicella marina]MCX7553301.1 LPS assembly protein LptD [Marinicella marina]MDJ1139033.1 LPS assembly protein LptD [Marinicella marina]
MTQRFFIVLFGTLINFAPLIAQADLSSCPAVDVKINAVQKHCIEQTSTPGKIGLLAKRSAVIEPGEFLLDGDICIIQDELRMMTPKLIYHQAEGEFDSEGGVMLQNGAQRISAAQAKFFSEDMSAQLEQVDFFLRDSDMNGQASNMFLQKNRSKLDNLTFSTCSPEQRDWEIIAQSAQLDHEKGVGTFKHVSLRFKDVPIFYVPWAKLPLNDDRRSGLLMPQISYSDNTGLDLALPYYLNIAPQVDATLTPRFLQQHGLMLGAELRYLSPRSNGIFSGTYLPDDDRRNRDRGLIEYNHRTRFAQGWSFNSDLNHVTDSQYYEDFASSSFLTATPYLRSAINVRGNGLNWRFFAGINDYQVLSQNITAANEPYQTFPEIAFDWFEYDYRRQLNYGISTELINFYREDSVGAWRSDITPWVEKQWSNAWGFIKPKLQYRSTYYQFDDEREDLSRNLPIASLDMGMTFEKSSTDGYKTIEPRLFYVYAPDRDQSDIPIFDSRELTFGSSLLFQTNRFSGGDRQSDMNQVAAALTHRSFTATGREQWNLTVGQIKYFDDQSVQINNQPEDLTKSPLVVEYNHFLSKYWNAGLSIHYDQVNSEMERGMFRVQRITPKQQVFNFAYRFRRNQLEQFDTSFVLPIKDQHRIIARWNYSTKFDKTIEAVFGYERKSCCWAFRLLGRHYLTDENGQSNNGIYAEIQLNGLGSVGRNPRRILKQTIAGYNEAF